MSPITLRSDRLAVEIAEPGSVYRRTRFDWTGFITQVTLDGAHTFCTVEDPDPAKGSGGIGLCNEFGNEKPIGYDDAAPGQTFAKPGVGLLVKPSNEPYFFYHDYEIAAPFPMQATATGEDTAILSAEPLDCRGYAFRQVKTIRVQDNCLEVAYRFENVGSRAIHTHEYAHNFLSIDHHPTGPDYRLTFAYPVQFENLAPLVRRMVRPFLRPLLPDFFLLLLLKRLIDTSVIRPAGNDVIWTGRPTRAFLARLAQFAPASGPQWRLTHLPSGLACAEIDDFAPSRVVVWGAAHVISAEVYTDIDLEPGEAQTWTRRYVFEKEP